MSLYRLIAICMISLAVSTPVLTFAAPKTSGSSSKVRYVVMLGSHDFAGLAAEEKTIMDNYRKGHVDTDEFSEQLIALVEPFSSSYIPDAELWVKTQPRSYAAHLCLGRLYLYAAWEARGNKFANQTSREQFDKMAELAQKALENLQASLTLFGKPYSSYTNLIEIDALLSQGKMRHYLDSAIKIDPTATHAYRRYFIYNTPRWGGSFKHLEFLLAEIRQGPMPPQKLADLEALLLGFKGNDESLHRNPAGAAALYLQAYERFPSQKTVWRLYWAATEFKKAMQIERAIEVYTKIINNYPDEDKAYFERGMIHSGMVNHELALKDFVASAQLGNKYAQNNAGYYYMVGRGGIKDLDLAKTYLSQSAAQGFKHAEEKLKVLESMR